MAERHSPTIAFDAFRTGEVIKGAGKFDEIDLGQLRFTAPKDAEDRGDSKVCLAKAFMLPGKGSLKIRLEGASIVKVTHSRADTHTVSIAIPGFESDLSAFLLSLDSRVLEVAQSNTNAWFLHKMNADLVEEYYRGCSSALPRAGIVGRFVIDGTGELPKAAAVAKAAPVSLALQLVGLQFRPQYFTCIWRLLDASASASPPAPASAPSPASASAHEHEHAPAAHQHKKSFSFVEEDEEGFLSDDDDNSGPSMELRAELRQDLMSRLITLQSNEQGRMDALLDMIRTLDQSSLHDLDVISEIDQRLSDLA